jgi:hypothetical protein
MPLFDLQWAISIINEKNLEQAGIISNFFAGILLAIEYFVIKDRIDQINNLLELHITNAYSKGLRIIKAYAKWGRVCEILKIANNRFSKQFTGIQAAFI